MRSLPIFYPLALALIVLVTLFTGAYAIASNALAEGPVGVTAYYPPLDGALTRGEAFETKAPEDVGDLQWYERAAIWVCPLH